MMPTVADEHAAQIRAEIDALDLIDLRPLLVMQRMQIERLNNDIHGLLIAINEVGSAAMTLADLLPDPHLDPDKVQAHYVRQCRQVLDDTHKAFAKKWDNPFKLDWTHRES